MHRLFDWMSIAVRLLASTIVSVVCALLIGCGGGSSSVVSGPPDFGIAVNPSTISLVTGTSTAVEVTVTSVNGFTGSVSLNVTGLPTGVSISPTPPQNIGPAGLSLTITTASSAVIGNYNLQFTATSASLQHSLTVPFTLGNRANLSIQVVQQNINVAQGSTAAVSINITAGAGIVDYTVSLQASTPAGVTATFSSTPVVPSATVTLKLAAAIGAAMGPGTVNIQATRSVDGFSVSTALPIYVDPQPGAIPGNRTNWVRLGSNPIAVYYDAPRNHVLASLPELNRIDVIDPSTGNLVSSIPAGVAGNEPNGVWLASSSNISSTLDGSSLFVLGVGHVSTVDLASARVIAQRPLPMANTPQPIFPTFLVAAAGGHMILGSWGNFSFYNWDGVSSSASLHMLSDIYSFDRSFDGTKVLVASGDTSGAYQLLDVATDTITAQGAYSNATIMTVRGNPARDEWAVANSNGVDFLDASLNLVARVPAALVGSGTYWGMTYSADGKYLYFVYAPAGIPFLETVDDTTHSVIRVAPATGTDIAYFGRAPAEWIVQPFAADNTGLVFGLGSKGLVIDDSTYAIDPTQATPADFAILATPDSGPLNAPTVVQITTQSYSAQPDVWFGTQRAQAESLNSAGQVSATAPPAVSSGPVNIKLFPPNGYVHAMPAAFTYGTIVTSVRNSICPVTGGCSTDVFGFGLFGANTAQTIVTIGGNSALVQSTHYFNADKPYPYPLQYVSVTVPPGVAGRADVAVTSAVGQSALPGGFLYATSLQSYSSSQTYNALLYDRRRGVLYASTNTAISRYSVSSSSFLTPITPPSLTGQNQFQAMSLTPDGSRLIVANKQDVSVAIVDPDNPTNAQAIAVPATGANPAGPVFVAATSTDKVLISIGGFVEPWVGPLYVLDLATLQIQPLTFSGGDSTRLCPTADGSTILIRGYGGPIAMWSATTEQFSSVADGFAGSGLGAAAGDGNVFAVGLGFFAPDGTSTVGMAIPDELGGFQSFFPNDATLNDSGSLDFVPSGKSLFILDTKHGDVLRSISLQNQVNVWTKVIAVDTTAQHVFLSDSQGLTILTLAAAPLSVGSVSPSIVPLTGSTVVTVRGSGFQPNTLVTIGGNTAPFVFVDANTLQVTTPAGNAGGSQMIIRNPDGESYQLDAGVTYQ